MTRVRVMLESGGNVFQATCKDEYGELFVVRAKSKGLLREKALRAVRDQLEGPFEVEWLDLDDSKD